MYSTSTVNTPLYSLGDTLVLTGSSTTTQSSGPYYVYSEYEDFSSDYASVSENYTYSSSGYGTDYYEYFTYSAEDGVTVNSVSKGYTDNIYDFAGRLEETYSLSVNQNDNGSSVYDNIHTSGTTYTYASTEGYQLLSSTSFASGTSTYAGITSSYSTTTDSKYGYSSTPTSTYDYDQKQSTTKVDGNGDGIIDYTQYSLYTNTSSGSTDVYVQVVQSGNIQASNNYEYTYASKNNGYTISNDGSFASDYDNDGIINTSNEFSSKYTYNSSGNLVSSNSQYIYRNDYDEDGKADYVTITKESRTQASGKSVELIWEDNSIGPATLSIGIDKDTNGDNHYESGRDFTFVFRTPPASWTAMGGHVATIADTVIV